jgi:hypothetical protein
MYSREAAARRRCTAKRGGWTLRKPGANRSSGANVRTTRPDSSRLLQWLR